MTKTTDLNDAAHPDEIPAILRRATDQANEAATELTAAWQDTGAGNPWAMVAKELEACADRIQRKL